MKDEIIVIMVLWALAIGIPLVFIMVNNVPLSREVDSEAVTAILTVSGIILGITTISERKRSTTIHNILTLVLYLPVYVLGFAGFSCFLDLIHNNHLTVFTLSAVTSSLLVSMNNWVMLRTIFRNL